MINKYKVAGECLKDIRKAIANEMVVDLKAIYKKEEHTHLIKDVYVQALDIAIDLLECKEEKLVKWNDVMSQPVKPEKENNYVSYVISAVVAAITTIIFRAIW